MIRHVKVGTYQAALLLDSRCFLRLPGKNVTDLASTQAILDLRRRAEMCKWLGLLIQNYNGNIYISTQGSIIMVINKQLKFPFWLSFHVKSFNLFTPYK